MYYLRITTQLKVNRTNQELLPIFEKLYITFNCLKKGLKEDVERLLNWMVVNFLKRTNKDKIPIVVGRDENNEIFLVALSVVNC